MSFFMNRSASSKMMAAPVITGAATLFLGQGGRQSSIQTTNSMIQRNMNSLVLRHVRRQQVSKKSFSSSTAAAKPDSGGFVNWYEGHLKARPVVTKAVTGSILWGLGDLVAQVVPTLMNDDATDGTLAKKKEFAYDYPRTARAVFFGFALHAPLSHLHFNFLEWMTVRGGFTGLSAPIFKTIMEQFVYWSWISNSLYHAAMSAMQGKTPTEIYERIENVLMDTQYAQWKFWIPVQLINFKFVPVRHQLNVVLITSVVWTALLSAWYPPEEENDGEESE